MVLTMYRVLTLISLMKLPVNLQWLLIREKQDMLLSRLS